jgi:hypothetical protein
MSPTGFRVTSEMVWRATCVFAVTDAAFVPVLVWRVNRSTSRQLAWALFATAATFWCGIWAWALLSFWDSVYRYMFPGWARCLIPPAYGLLFAGVGVLSWRLALRFPGSPVISFCLSGGLWGMITHLWAVHLGIVEKPPVLQGVAPAAAVTLAVFEFLCSWCIILSVAALLHHGWRWLSGQPG